MALIESILALFVSLAVLAYAGHIVLKSSIKISRYFRIAEFTVGFIFVAIATTLPELSVSINAALIGEGGIVIGNAIGSNIADILAVLGLGALAGTVWVRGKLLVDSAEVLLLMTIIPVILLGRGTLGFGSGLVLIALFFVYVFITSKTGAPMKIAHQARAKDKFLVVAVFLLSMAALLISARFAVESTADIALLLGIRPSIIGLTILAFGTSLPELIICLGAVRTGHPEIALGDILGACVVNLTLVLGVGAVITPLNINYVVLDYALLFLIGATIVLNYLLFKYRRISKTAGLGFVLAYIIFLMWQIGVVSFV